MLKAYNKVILLFLRIINKVRKTLGYNSILLSSKALLYKNFKERSKFRFVQVGANDGVSFDFLFDFVSNRKSEGVVIEPVPSYFIELKKHYSNMPKVIKVNKAVHPKLKQVDIFKINPNHTNKYPKWVKGIASLDPAHHKKSNINSEHILKETVLADNLSNIFKEHYKPDSLDYFQIDTEGFDFEILKMIDFNKITPSIIKYESVNLNKDDKSLSKSLLIQNGFYTFDEGGDSLGVNLNKIKLF